MAPNITRIGSSSSTMIARGFATRLSYVSAETSKKGPTKIASRMAIGIRMATTSAPTARITTNLITNTTARMGRKSSLIGKKISLNASLIATDAKTRSATAPMARKKNVKSVMSVTTTMPPRLAYGGTGFGLRLPGPSTRPDVDRLGPDHAIRPTLFPTVGDPAGDPADGKGRREQRCLQPKAVQEQGGVELDVCLQAPAGFVLLEKANSGALADARVEPLGRRRENVSARVAYLVDTVAEAHQLLSRFDLPSEHLFGP